MEIVIKTILRQIITDCRGTQDVIKNYLHVEEKVDLKRLRVNCV